MEIALKQIRRSIFIKAVFILTFLSLLVSFIQYRYIPSVHELITHGSQSALAIMCLNKNGSNQAYKFYVQDEERRAWTCFDDGNWFILLTKAPEQENNTLWLRGRSSFMLEDETIEQWKIRKISENYELVDENISPNSSVIGYALLGILSIVAFIKSRNRMKNRTKKQ